MKLTEIFRMADIQKVNHKTNEENEFLRTSCEIGKMS